MNSSSRSQPVLSPKSDSDAPCYLLMKRGLYYRPNSMGYTGIKDNAGLYTRAEAEDHADPISGVSFVHWNEAGEVAPKCFNDIAVEHLLGKLAKVQRERDEARDRCRLLYAALTPSSDTKAAYIGEVKFPVSRFDADGDEHVFDMTVPWDATKDIMAMIVGYVALQSPVRPADGAERVHEGGLRDEPKPAPTKANPNDR